MANLGPLDHRDDCPCACISERDLAEHDRQVAEKALREASAALDEDTAFNRALEKRIINNQAFNELGICDDVQDSMVAWIASRADALSNDATKGGER